MKKTVSASFIGIAIVMALDSFARIVISLYMQHDILMIAYSSYPGAFWPLLLTIIAGGSAFAGGIFALSYGHEHKITVLSIFGLLVAALRYLQVHLLIDREPLLYPIIALILSLLGLLLAWQFIRKRAEKKATHHFPEESAEDV